MAELEFREVVRQGYSDMHIASGFVDGHEVDTVDTVYFEIVREDGSDPVHVIMRPDELAALMWVCAGTLWSDHMERLAAERGTSSESADGGE